MKVCLILIFSIFIITLEDNRYSNRYSEDSYNPNPITKGGKDNFTPIPLSSSNLLPLNEKETKSKRSLDSNGFKDFNIFLDLKNFEDEVKKYNLKNKRDLFVKGMQKAIKTLQSLLKVKLTRNYIFTDANLRKVLIFNWDRTKIGSEIAKEKGMIDLGIDLYIFVRFGNNSELGNNALASGGARYTDPYTNQPLLGVVNINREGDFTRKNALHYFEGIIIHVFTHILGFSKSFCINYFHNYFTKIDKYGIERAYINSTKVINVAKNYFKCNEIEGVELENNEEEGASDAHWEARILLGEYMNGFIYTPEQVISEFTLALLEDSGYYKAKYYTGGLMQFGKNKGCEFLNSKCVNKGKINSNFSNEFFSKIKNEIFNIDTSCSSGRQSRAYHFLYKYNDDLPKVYQHYLNPKIGGHLSSTDYCPVSMQFQTEEDYIYYVGHCSEKGGKTYGSLIPYKDLGNNIITYESGDLSPITGEIQSSNSFCVLSSLILKILKISKYIQIHYVLFVIKCIAQINH